MADKYLSNIGTTASITGGYTYIILPDGGSPTGYTSYKITVANLQAALSALISGNTSAISALASRVTSLESVSSRDVYTEQTSSLEHTQPSAWTIYRIFIISNIPSSTVEIGTTLAGNDLWGAEEYQETTVTNTSPLIIREDFWTDPARTVYFTITGDVNIVIFSTKDGIAI